MLGLFLAQSSLLVAPVYLDAAPPETRAVAVILSKGFSNEFDGGFFEMKDLRDGMAAGEDLVGMARAHARVADAGSSVRPYRWTGILGTFPRGMLAPGIDGFLFAAEAGELSDPIRIKTDWSIAQRLERDAACRQIFVAGTDDAARAEADAIAKELANGADFAQLARERSEDRASALRGGDLAIFERGPDDALLREAAFRAKVGEIVGPIESPLGLHFLQRVAVEALDPRLRDDVWARARAILIANDGANGADSSLHRSFVDAQRLADDLAARIRRGDDMIALASEHTDDRGGRERAGDLGWVRRNTTHMPPAFDRLFLEPPGDLIGPLVTEFGFVLLRREDPGLRSRIALRKSAAVDRELWARNQPNAAPDELERRFVSEVWPEHERLIEGWRSRFLAAHGPVLEACLDDAMAALGIRDPCVVIDVHMTASPFTNGYSELDSPVCVDACEQDVHRALEGVIAAALRVLDRVSSPHWGLSGQERPPDTARSELRAGLTTRVAEEGEYRSAIEARIVEQARASAARAIAIGRR